MIEMSREWAMPNKNTFSIEPIRRLLDSIVNREKLWIDPYSAGNRYAKINNDLNPNIIADYHLEAIDFLKIFKDGEIDGVLYDPPYSIRQVNECYDKVGRDHVKNDGYYADVKNEIARVIRPGGICVSFGWNSNGLGMSRGFEIKKIKLVPHGSRHYDTIVTVESKMNKVLT